MTVTFSIRTCVVTEKVMNIGYVIKMSILHLIVIGCNLYRLGGSAVAQW